MKNALIHETVIIGFLSLSSAIFGTYFATAFPYQCKQGVECLPLDKCSGLYRRWQEDKATYNHTVEVLLCEKYEPSPNKLPKVCCAAKLFLTNDAPPLIKPVTRTLDLTNELRSNTQDVICGVHNADRIIGGSKTQIDEYPWIALLRFDNNFINATGYYCGGVILSSRYILTAAHCVYTSLPGWNVTHAILGEWNTSTKRDCDADLCNVAIEVPIEKATVHPEYNRNDASMLNDIALLRLARDVQFNDFVKPICLPTDPSLLNNNFEGYDLHVAGWGKTDVATASEVKLKVSLPVYDHTKCQDQYYRQGKKNVTDNQFCIGGQKGKDSCKGDSGGPLMGEVSSKNRWTVVGVVSYGPTPCGTEGWPGIYTRVTPYLKWIQDNMTP